MKKLILTFLMVFIISGIQGAYAQSIYGFSGNVFCSINISDNTKDSLIVFSGNPSISFALTSSIDRYNGRYFFGGNLPGYNGNFHIIDLIYLTIESYLFIPENIEYDFIKNRIVYENNGILYSFDLSKLELSNIGVIENGNSGIFGQKSTFVPQTNQYFYVDYVYGSEGDPYFLMVDTDSGQIDCQELVEKFNGFFHSPGGLVTNYLTGDIIGHRNGQYGIVNACEGTMTKLSKIADYHSHLNNQMAVYNHNRNAYIIPYYSNNPIDTYKIAIVDVYNDEIIKTISQPWGGRMNLQQIYDKPIVASLIYLNDTLFVPKGKKYRWFLNGEWIGETNTNYWVPMENGIYYAEVDFREYSTHSTELQILLSSNEDGELTTDINVYPNPVLEFININFPHSKLVNIRITDLTGKVIFNIVEKNTSNTVISLSDLLNGVYLLTIETDKNHLTKLVTKF